MTYTRQANSIVELGYHFISRGRNVLGFQLFNALAMCSPYHCCPESVFHAATEGPAAYQKRINKKGIAFRRRNRNQESTKRKAIAIEPASSMSLSSWPME
jgi:hypothetical protein